MPLLTRAGLAALLCLLATLACGGDGAERGRVLLIGIDGATFRIAGPLLEAGRLPNLGRLAAEGVSGPLRSLKPLHSPVIWNSVVTGKKGRKHGILGFARQDEQGELKLFLSSDRRTHALWNIASREGLEVGVVNFWNTYPTENVRGVMVSDHIVAREISGREELTGATAPMGGDIIHPVEQQGPLLGLLGIEPAVVPNENPFVGKPGLGLSQLSHFFRTDGDLTRIALQIEDDSSPDLLMVLLPGIDRVSHFLWRNVEPPEAYPPELRPTDEQRTAGAAALDAYYEYTDALIGRLLERFGPDDLVIVLSDHGFEAGVGKFNLTGTHVSDAALHGVLFARGRDLKPGRPAATVSVLDITPTILAWWGLPLGEDMDGKPGVLLADDRAERSTIPTWDTEPIERASAEASGAEEDLLEHLRSLGYVE